MTSQTEKTNKVQLRGHCQCCGRERAVTNNRMAHHGYTVDYGYFNGTCAGRDSAPMEVSRERADAFIVQLRNDAAIESERAIKIEANGLSPDAVVKNFRGDDCRFSDLDEYRQIVAVRAAAANARGLARYLEGIADTLAAIADRVHGKPLIVSERAAPPERIVPGERRVTDKGSVLTATHLRGARVYFVNENGRSGWWGSSAWRRWPKA